MAAPAVVQPEEEMKRVKEGHTLLVALRELAQLLQIVNSQTEEDLMSDSVTPVLDGQQPRLSRETVAALRTFWATQEKINKLTRQYAAVNEKRQKDIADYNRNLPPTTVEIGLQQQLVDEQKKLGALDAAYRQAEHLRQESITGLLKRKKDAADACRKALHEVLKFRELEELLGGSSFLDLKPADQLIRLNAAIALREVDMLKCHFDGLSEKNKLSVTALEKLQKAVVEQVRDLKVLEPEALTELETSVKDAIEEKFSQLNTLTKEQFRQVADAQDADLLREINKLLAPRNSVKP